MRVELERAVAKISADDDGVPLALLIGAGPSMESPANLPNWKGFLERLAAEMEKYKPSRAVVMREEIANGNFLEAAAVFVGGNHVPKPERAKVMREVFDRPPAEIPAVYELLAAVPASFWITTNYDPFLKYAVNEKHPEAEILSNSTDDLRSAQSVWTTKKFALYLHGRSTVYESVVYTPASYDRLYSRPECIHFLKKLFTECRVLAYGHSCSDPELRKILEFVADQLGGATQHSHYILYPAGASCDLELLRRANFVTVEYSPENSHAEAKEVLRALARSVGPAAQPPVLPNAQSQVLRSLVAIYLSLADGHGVQDTYSTSSAALVLHVGASELLTDRAHLVTSVRHLAGVDHNAAERIVETGLSVLIQQGRVQRLKDNNLRFVPTNGGPPHSAFIKAVETRIASYNSRFRASATIKEAIRLTVTHVMVAQGMTIARSFLNEEDLRGYDLEALVNEATSLFPRLPDGIGDDFKRSICEILHSPSSEVAESLARLSYAACSLETVFLNPEEPIGELLRWKVYLDSNVVLRMISKASRFHWEYRGLVRKLRRLKTPVAILLPFVREVERHVTSVRRRLKNAAVRDEATLVKYVSSIPQPDRSPIVEWYTAVVHNSGWVDFETFAQKHFISSEQRITKLLDGMGISVEGDEVLAKLDTSERETLWDSLREWRQDQSFAGRRLRRNEATQVEWMVRLRNSGTRTWFLSQDAQLRRALITLQKGYYAGFVVPPAVLAFRLGQVHWGEVDLAGFSAMMWSLPAPRATDKARDIIIQRLTATHPDLQELDPEWLRDRVEHFLAKGLPATAVRQAGDLVDEDEEDDVALGSIIDQLMPTAASAILDEMAKKRTT